MTILRKEYQDLATGQVRSHLLVTQHRLFESGDEEGKLLAWLGNKERESRLIGSIRGENRELGL